LILLNYGSLGRLPGLMTKHLQLSMAHKWFNRDKAVVTIGNCKSDLQPK
jgi:hypothetical protein